jgi:hypothetical protein
MKNTLWTFGDSMTFGHGCNIDCESNTKINYLPYKKEGDDIWPNHLSKLLNYSVVNLGKNGASNDYILDCIIDNFDNIEPNDVVVINMTLHGRIEVPFKDGTYDILCGYEKNKIFVDNIESHIYNVKNKTNENDDEKIEALINFQYHFSNHQFYKDRHTKRFNFIKNRLLKEKNVRFVFLWSLEEDLGIYASFQTISDATNGVVNDTHFSFNGHFNFAHFLYKTISSNRFII